MKVDELLGLIEDKDDSEEQTRKDELVEQDVHADEQIQQEVRLEYEDVLQNEDDEHELNITCNDCWNNMILRKMYFLRYLSMKTAAIRDDVENEEQECEDEFAHIMLLQENDDEDIYEMCIWSSEDIGGYPDLCSHRKGKA